MTKKIKQDDVETEPTWSILTPANYAHCVVDLETLNTTTDAVVLTIGAIKLDVHGRIMTGIGSHLYLTLSIEDQLMHGRTIGVDTVSWWKSKSVPAQEAAFSVQRITPLEALGLIAQFLAPVERSVSFKPLLWGNGVDFDNCLLASLFKAYEIDWPLHYRSNADFRTLRLLFPEVDGMWFEGIRHHALDDALHEARGLESLLLTKCIPNPFEAQAKEPNKFRCTLL